MGLSLTVLTVLSGAALLGAVGAVVGSFAMLRRQSLLGDALAHAALPGVCLAFLITGQRNALGLLAGAIAAGLLGAMLIVTIVRGSRIKEDAAIGIVLSVFFGMGVVLITHIQKLPIGNKAGLDRYIFGQAASLTRGDVVLIAAVGALVLAAVLLSYRQLEVLCFDRDFGKSLGLPMRGTEFLITALLVLVVVVGLQMVGAILMVATLITPPAAARQWTDRLGVMLLLAALLGALCGAGGAWASAVQSGLPTGPAIVLAAAAALLVSIMIAPRRGILWARLRGWRAAERIRRENLLKDIYRAGEAAGDPAAAVSSPLLMGLRGHSAHALRRVARKLAQEGLVGHTPRGDLKLTPRGLLEASQVVRRHRLWELYLTHRLELPADHVHRDAEAMEHVLSEEAVVTIDRLLGHPRTDPHGRPIPPASPPASAEGATR